MPVPLHHHHLLHQVVQVVQVVQAIQEMQKTVGLEPEFSAAHFQLAVLYSRTGDKQRATWEAAVVKQLKEKVRNSDAEQATEK